MSPIKLNSPARKGQTQTYQGETPEETPVALHHVQHQTDNSKRKSASTPEHSSYYGPLVKSRLEPVRITPQVSARTVKALQRFLLRKQKRQEIAAASLFKGEDLRLYGRIMINEQAIEGLLDSGATVTWERVYGFCEKGRSTST